MKINLEVENKEVVFPEFELFREEKDSSIIIIAMKNINFEEKKMIIQSINENNFHLKISETSILFKTHYNTYFFNVNTINKNKLIIDFLIDYDKIEGLATKIINYENKC